MLLYSSRSSCLTLRGHLPFWRYLLRNIEVNYMVWMAWLSFQTTHARSGNMVFHSSHSLFWQGRPYRALSWVFWVILIHDRQGWPQMATVFCPDHHSKPRDTDSFSAQRMLGSSCWGQRPNEISADAESRNSLTPGAQVWSVPWRSGALGSGGQAQLDPHTLLEQSQRVTWDCSVCEPEPGVPVESLPDPKLAGVHKTILQHTSP